MRSTLASTSAALRDRPLVGLYLLFSLALCFTQDLPTAMAVLTLQVGLLLIHQTNKGRVSSSTATSSGKAGSSQG